MIQEKLLSFEYFWKYYAKWSVPERIVLKSLFLKKSDEDNKAIRTASANSMKFRGIRPQMFIEDLLWYYDADVTEITSVIAAKPIIRNEVYVFSIKYGYNDILLKNT